MLARGSKLPSNRPAPPALALVHRARPSGKPSMAWLDKADIARAKTEGDVLVQHFEQGRIVYTIDPQLQQQALDYLRSYQVPYAAMMMYELSSGAVLVMAGRSQAEPQIGPQELCLTPWAPAASVFKLITASALLERGVPPTAAVCYHGGTSALGRANLQDNPRLDRSCHTLADAISKSINAVIGKLALRHLDRASLLSWTERFGFNRPIPFDLPALPSRADIPDEELERARTAAGFWHTDISALHGAVIAGVAASGGFVEWPHVIRRIERADGRQAIPQRRDSERILSEDSARQLRRMMVRSTIDGTARRGFMSRRGRPLLPQIEVGGKTGSLTRINPQLSYSWFVGFAPAAKPEVAFAVLLGNPPRWRIKASTAARVMLAHYLESRSNRAQAGNL